MPQTQSLTHATIQLHRVQRHPTLRQLDRPRVEHFHLLIPNTYITVPVLLVAHHHDEKPRHSPPPLARPPADPQLIPQHTIILPIPIDAGPSVADPAAADVGRILHDAGEAGVAAVELHETAGRVRAGAQLAHHLDGVQRHAAQPAQLQRGRLRALQRRQLRRLRALHLPLSARRGERAAGGRAGAHQRGRRPVL